jgi:putative PIN family toxin of toxin-antitoxin system
MNGYFFAIIGNIMLIRAVLDTNILVAGFSSQSGASYALLEHAMSGRFVMLASPALWLEYEATLKRADIVQLHGLTEADIDDALNALAGVVTSVQSHFLWRPQLRDPKDELVLEAAVNGMARYLITLNVRDFTPAAHTFGIALSNPAKLLNLVETSS